MKVSIMMCAYNTSAYIREAIESILAQTYTNWELIIGDDCSSDDTVAIVKSYMGDNRIKLVAHKSNMGYIRNKNSIFAAATGDLLTQLDADDTCPPDRIERQVKVFETYPEIKVCATNYQTIDIQGNPIETVVYEHDFVIKELMRPYPFWYPGMMFHKDIIAEFGLFSEYFDSIYGDDNYYAYRVNSKYPIYFIKDPLYYYRIHPASMTNVHDKPRKLIADDILKELFTQRKNTGTDWLEEGHIDKMKAYEDMLFHNGRLMAEKYRIWAAKAIDNNNWPQARYFLKKSMGLSLVNTRTYVTLSYYLRNRFLK